MRWFSGRDRNRPYAERIRPGAFGLLAQPVELVPSGGVLPAAPYEDDPSKWSELEWYDRQSGQPVSVTTADPVREPIQFARDMERGAIRVRTLGDVLDAYSRRPEHKSLAPDGTAATATTVGRLRRRPVRSAPSLTKLAGKEGNRLLERVTGVVVDPIEYRTEFGARVDPWPTRPPGSAGDGHEGDRCANVRQVAELDRAGAEREGDARRKAELTSAAAGYARERLSENNVSSPADDLITLAEFRPFGLGSRLCACGCGRAAPSPRSRWFSDACRKRAARQHQRPLAGAGKKIVAKRTQQAHFPRDRRWT
jgi:hypothetical protein